MSPAAWLTFPVYYYNLNGHRLGPHSIAYVDDDALCQSRWSQPWQKAVEQGLTLAIQEAIGLGKYRPTPNGHDIWFALQCWMTDFYEKGKFTMSDFEHYERIVAILIEAGASSKTVDIIQCFHSGNRLKLELLLKSKPQGKIKLNRSKLHVPDSLDAIAIKDYTYAGEPVGPLWELARARPCCLLNIEPMFEYLLERGEDLDEICGPGGTMLHAVVIDSVQPLYQGQVRLM